MALAARTRGRDDVMTSSVPGAATRFRSPTPKVTGGRGEPTMASQVVKRSRRTKSQESHEREPQRLNLKTEYKDKESVAASIWQSFGKDVEKMRHEELVSKFKLLLNEHMKLEKFLSFCLREHEISKNQMECELLDAMIYIEDLKKALETKLARKNRVMPVEAEERRALIRQNKKLLKQLYETAKKVEKLEAVNDEQKEQLEVMEFQVMEAENHRIVMDEVIREHGLTEKPLAKIHTAVQVKMMSNDELTLKRELGQLRSQNAELRRQLQLADDENSLAESDMGAVHVVENMKVQLAQKDNLLRELEERIKGLQKQVDTAKRQAAVMQRHVARQSHNAMLNTGVAPESTQSMQDDEDESTEADATEPIPEEEVEGPEKAAAPEGEKKDGEEGENGEEEGGAMSALIRASFFPLSFPVPIEEQAVPFSEKLPQIMKERKDDSLLMETIRTFQNLVDERENEIGELKARLKELGAYSSENRPEIRFIDCDAQTNLAMEQCQYLERHLEHLEAAEEGSPLHQLEEALKEKDDMSREIEEILRGMELKLAASGLLEQPQLDMAEGLPLAQRVSVVQAALDRLSHPNKLEEVNRELRERLEKMEAEKDGIISQVREANLVLQKNLEAMEDTGNVRSLLKGSGKCPPAAAEMLERIQQLERDNRRWKSHVEHMGRSEDELLSTIANLEESLRDAHARDTANRLQLQANTEELKSALLSTNTAPGPTAVGGAEASGNGSPEGERNIRYYSMQLQDIHYQSVIDQLRRKLELDSKKRREVERRLDEVSEAERRMRKEKEALEGRLQTTKRMESALKKRVEVLETEPGDSEALCPHNTRIMELESEVTTLADGSRLDQSKLHQLGVRLSEMEAVNRAYMDRIHELEMRDLAANKKMLRLQATYEDMMREYSDVKAHDNTWRKRAKAYETMEASLAQTKASYEAVLKRMEEEVARLNASVQRLSGDNDKLRERCNEYSTRIRESQTNAMAIAGELEAHKRGNQDSLDRLSAAAAKNHLMESRLREIEDEKARNDRRLRLVEDQKATLLVESSNLQLTNQELSRQLGTARASCEALKEELEVVSCRQTQSQRHQDDLLIERLDWERKAAEFERDERNLKRRLQQHEETESKLKQKVLQLESRLMGTANNTNAKALSFLHAGGRRSPIRHSGDVEEVLENSGHLQDQIHFLKSTCDSQSAEISRLRSHILTLEGDLAESQATYMPPPGFVLVTQGEYEKMKRKTPTARSPHPTTDC